MAHPDCLLGLPHHHRIMNGATVTHDIFVRYDELPERGLDLVEVDVGDESIDAGIDAGRLAPMHIAARRNEIGQHLQIREPARIGGVGGVAADSLEVIALEIELLRLA
jgi:hypothetical protein